MQVVWLQYRGKNWHVKYLTGDSNVIVKRMKCEAIKKKWNLKHAFQNVDGLNYKPIAIMHLGLNSLIFET